jgi:hypothetical protein
MLEDDVLRALVDGDAVHLLVGVAHREIGAVDRQIPQGEVAHIPQPDGEAVVRPTP